MYLLLDSNVTAGYYLPRSLSSTRARHAIETIFDSVRSGQTSHFFYLPNFCVAEVFGVFMKHSFGRWNSQVRPRRTIDKRVYRSLCDQFRADIHNGKFIYHYELSRYHVLAINLVAPVDHYYRVRRGNRRRVTPMGTFDQLIIAMGLHLARIHGPDNVAIISTDDRLTDIHNKCRFGFKPATMKRLHLNEAEQLTGITFDKGAFPKCLNLKHATKKDFQDVFGQWPLPVSKMPQVYRWTRV